MLSIKHDWKWEGLDMCRKEGNHSKAKLVEKEKIFRKKTPSISNSIGTHRDLAVL